MGKNPNDDRHFSHRVHLYWVRQTACNASIRTLLLPVEYSDMVMINIPAWRYMLRPVIWSKMCCDLC